MRRVAAPVLDVHGTNGTSIGSAVFVGLAVVPNRQTHRPRYMCGNRPHLASGVAKNRPQSLYLRLLLVASLLILGYDATASSCVRLRVALDGSSAGTAGMPMSQLGVTSVEWRAVRENEAAEDYGAVQLS